MLPERLEALIASIGRVPKQRTTLYGTPTAERMRAAVNSTPLDAIPEPASLSLGEPVDTQDALMYLSAEHITPGSARAMM
jgi:hypothetical protein